MSPLLPLDLDFGNRSRRRKTTATLLLGAAIACLLAPPVYEYQLLQRKAALQAEQQKAASGRMPQRTSAAAQTDARTVKLAARLSVRWDQLLQAVEQASAPGVTLLSLQSSSAKGELLLSGEAARYTDVVDYLERLRAQPAFSQVFLRTHEIARDEPGKPVKFNIVARWQGAE